MVRGLARAAAVCCAVTALVAAPAAVSAAAVPPAGAEGLTAGQLRVGAGGLKVLPEDPDPAPAGGVVTVHALVANEGSARSAAFTVTVVLPEGATPEEQPDQSYFPQNCAAVDRTVTCHYPKGLPVDHTATAIIPARLSADATGVLEGGTVSVAEDSNPSDTDTASYVIQVSTG
ncbi:hypothetical protein CFP65_1393 [Kitasatospora sp. MMS16-BH015]|uniref:hypothetical protein n=1 Tax=Kitasatospora sp. MMS16-BH015 TaxID=2018025 RepID=UPI000CA36E01|nr:hypothetical protein [Kitasatospora sp. MMS16-BH015]AUG76292.1 hypothetical protein CFP65_1393 [Kitasatospora sp. MMS16-BH015]